MNVFYVCSTSHMCCYMHFTICRHSIDVCHCGVWTFTLTHLSLFDDVVGITAREPCTLKEVHHICLPAGETQLGLGTRSNQKRELHPITIKPQK